VRPELQERLDELSKRVGFEHPSPHVLVAGVALALVAAVFVGKWMAGTSSAGVEIPSSAPPVAAQPAVAAAAAGASASVEASIVVHVVGAVRHPGVYRLTPGSRAEDAVFAAGGPLGSAQLAAVNLAAPLADGEQVVVPKKGEAAAAAAPSGSSIGVPAAPGQKVDLNTASESELDTLPGVGPATAKRIVEDRQTNGPFRAPEDLMRVPGIGPKKFDSLKDLVRT